MYRTWVNRKGIDFVGWPLIGVQSKKAQPSASELEFRVFYFAKIIIDGNQACAMTEAGKLTCGGKFYIPIVNEGDAAKAEQKRSDQEVVTRQSTRANSIEFAIFQEVPMCSEERRFYGRIGKMRCQRLIMANAM